MMSAYFAEKLDLLVMMWKSNVGSSRLRVVDGVVAMELLKTSDTLKDGLGSQRNSDYHLLTISSPAKCCTCVTQEAI